MRYFLGTLRILLPLPGRYTKWWGLNFTYGLRYIKTSNERTYIIKKGLKYVVPYELYKQFFKILRDAISYGKYQTFPVIVNKGDVIIDCGAHIGRNI